MNVYSSSKSHPDGHLDKHTLGVGSKTNETLKIERSYWPIEQK
jgi:hypothetical protein